MAKKQEAKKKKQQLQQRQKSQEKQAAVAVSTVNSGEYQPRDLSSMTPPWQEFYRRVMEESQKF